MPTNEDTTFYDTLGVSKGVSQDELRKAWLALARKYHPDKTGGHKGSEEKLKHINEAYDTLKRPEKRREYDEMLAGSFQAGNPTGKGAQYARSPNNGSARTEHSEYNVNYADFFGDLFGQKTQKSQRMPQPGQDIETQISISLKEAAIGVKRTFRIPSMAVCSNCAGTGAAPGTSLQQCPYCKGTGHIFNGQGSLFVMSQLCPLCRGKGNIIVTPCPACRGSGFTAENHALSITIPAGVRTGTRLRLAGQGEPGEPGAPAGDLYLVIDVEENELFHRERNDILCNVPITFTQAVLGGIIEVPTLQGKAAQLTIPAGTQTGAILRMRGQGFPAFNGGHQGDQLVRVVVETPRNINLEQRAVIQNLHETSSPNAYPKRQAFAEKLKRWCNS
jgi:molecular chaperone DnaJ